MSRLVRGTPDPDQGNEINDLEAVRRSVEEALQAAEKKLGVPLDVARATEIKRLELGSTSGVPSVRGYLASLYSVLTSGRNVEFNDMGVGGWNLDTKPDRQGITWGERRDTGEKAPAKQILTAEQALAVWEEIASRLPIAKVLEMEIK
ncbi:MAG: hypothetical protein V1760_03225 [Candidatus Peregrinibacteria bacterium]